MELRSLDRVVETYPVYLSANVFGQRLLHRYDYELRLS